MRGEQEALPDFSRRSKPGEEIGTTGKNFLKFNVESGLGGDGGKKIRDALFAGAGVTGGQEGGIHAGQRDQVAQQFFGFRHAGFP